MREAKICLRLSQDPTGLNSVASAEYSNTYCRESFCIILNRDLDPRSNPLSISTNSVAIGRTKSRVLFDFELQGYVVDV